MTLDELPIERGLNMFLCRSMPSGKKKYSGCEVMDVNPHVKAVKVRYAISSETIKTEWVPIGQLSWKVPAEEQPK